MPRKSGWLRSGRRPSWPAKQHFRPAISIEATRDRRFFQRLAVPPIFAPWCNPSPEFTHPTPCLATRPRLELAANHGARASPVMAPGEVAEWLNAPHSKCGIGASLSGVRIPPSPPEQCFRPFHFVSSDARNHSINRHLCRFWCSKAFQLASPKLTPKCM